MTSSATTPATDPTTRAADRATAADRIRQRLDPRRRSSPQRPWEPLSDVDWAVLSPFLFRHNGPGRPVRDPRGRLDAIFWLAARPQRHLPPWHALPPEFGKHDTVARQFRRWAHAGLWTRLLQALADPEHPGIEVLRRLESWVCRSYRRAWRLLGVGGVVLARTLGFLSALRAPSVFLPDPHLSEYVKSRLRSMRERLRGRGVRAAMAMLPSADFLHAANKLLWAAGGGRRINWYMAPW
jgi:transposase